MKRVQLHAVTDNSHDGLNFDPSNANKIFHYSGKERLKISKMAKFSGEMAVVNDGKYSPVKFANFVDIRIIRVENLPFAAEM